MRLDESATGETLDRFATRSGRAVEKELEALVADGRIDIDGKPVITPVSRKVASGIVSRLDLPSGDRSDTPEDEAVLATPRFLVTPCEDGARTLEITGPAPAPQPNGAPDAGTTSRPRSHRARARHRPSSCWIPR